MGGWSAHEGTALGLNMENIDTDQLIPARFMSVSRTDGYGPYLLHDMRVDQDGLQTDFPLNHHKPTVLIARRNFGSGSSREAAVYALVDFGIKVVIAPSFGDIFASNAVNNGLLPARVSEDVVEQLLADIGPEMQDICVDLDIGQIDLGARHIPFEIDPVWRQKLMNGWDDIDLTQSHTAEIETFGAARPSWAIPFKAT
jgi:3-isopropylmalate/(R)-2-methylmalate dehydratase small subunit